MTDQQKHHNTTVRNENTSTASVKQAKQPKTGARMGRGLWISIALLLSLIAIVLAAYSYWQLRQIQSSTQQSNSTTSDELNLLHNSVNTEHNTRQDALTTLEQQVAQLKTTQQHLRSEIKTTYAVATPDIALNITAANILLALFVQQVNLYQPKTDMLQLLQQVKLNLITAKISSTLISQLDDIYQATIALPNLQRTQAMATLRDLSTSLNELHFKLPVSKEASAHDEQVTGWRSAWHNSWDHLRSLLIIHTHETIEQSLLTDTNRKQVAISLHTLLQQSIWDVMIEPQQFEQTLNTLAQQVQQVTQADQAQHTWLTTLASVKKLAVSYPHDAVTSLLSQTQKLSHALYSLHTDEVSS